MKEEKKGLLAYVYTSADLGGLTTFNRVTIIEDGSNPVPQSCQVFTPSEKAPGVRIIRRTLWGKEYVHIEPIQKKPDGHAGYMYGGKIIDASDSRFGELMGHPYPVHFHDRTEAQWSEA